MTLIAEPQPTVATDRAQRHRRASSVAFEGLGRAFPTRTGARPVLRDVTVRIEPGEIVAIVGASGCGKSTLLRTVGGLDRPTTGRVTIDGTPVAAYDERSAIGFQEPRLLPWRTIAANVALGLPPRTAAAEGRARVARLLDLVGLAEFADHRPRQVSGGMAQRASLARALARDPGVLLLDEPFGALDALTRMRMQDLLLQVHAATSPTVLLVTHDVDEALQLADRILLLGSDDDTPGAGIRAQIVVPGARPRDRASSELAHLRGRILEGLGIDRHAAH